jgi:hypothetical protein
MVKILSLTSHTDTTSYWVPLPSCYILYGLHKKWQYILQNQSHYSCVTVVNMETCSKFFIIVETQKEKTTKWARDNYREERKKKHAPGSLKDGAALETERFRSCDHSTHGLRGPKILGAFKVSDASTEKWGIKKSKNKREKEFLGNKLQLCLPHLLNKSS